MKIKTLCLCTILFILGYDVSYSQNCDLPTVIPNTLAGIEAANKIIAECYAPTIHQMAEREHEHSAHGRADLITSVHYDRLPNGEIDYDCTNNWENLGNYYNEDDSTLDYDELDPVVYYSVVWTNLSWVVTYGFYHPRDYAGYVGVCCWDNHENNFEGAILVINRSTNNVTGG